MYNCCATSEGPGLPGLAGVHELTIDSLEGLEASVGVLCVQSAQSGIAQEEKKGTGSEMPGVAI